MAGESVPPAGRSMRFVLELAGGFARVGRQVNSREIVFAIEVA